jgi:hypothetical protein
MHFWLKQLWSSASRKDLQTAASSKPASPLLRPDTNQTISEASASQNISVSTGLLDIILPGEADTVAMLCPCLVTTVVMREWLECWLYGETLSLVIIANDINKPVGFVFPHDNSW